MSSDEGDPDGAEDSATRRGPGSRQAELASPLRGRGDVVTIHSICAEAVRAMFAAGFDVAAAASETESDGLRSMRRLQRSRQCSQGWQLSAGAEYGDAGRRRRDGDGIVRSGATGSSVEAKHRPGVACDARCSVLARECVGSARVERSCYQAMDAPCVSRSDTPVHSVTRCKVAHSAIRRDAMPTRQRHARMRWTAQAEHANTFSQPTAAQRSSQLFSPADHTGVAARDALHESHTRGSPDSTKRPLCAPLGTRGWPPSRERYAARARGPVDVVTAPPRRVTTPSSLVQTAHRPLWEPQYDRRVGQRSTRDTCTTHSSARSSQRNTQHDSASDDCEHNPHSSIHCSDLPIAHCLLNCICQLFPALSLLRHCRHVCRYLRLAAWRLTPILASALLYAHILPLRPVHALWPDAGHAQHAH